MKRTLVKFVCNRVMSLIALTGAVMMVVPFQTKANTKKIEILSDNNQASVQYLGSADNGLLFSVKIANPTGEKFTLMITDENGETLFSKDFSDISFNRKIKLLKNDNGSRFNFIVKSKNKDLDQTFVVNTTEKIINEVVVTKL